MKEWPVTPVPAWLAAVTSETMQDGLFPLADILGGSMYYPASGFDGTVIEYLSSRVHSFIHVDYGLTREELDGEFLEHGFKGYRILGRRAVTKEELAPNGWAPLPLMPTDGNPARAVVRGTPFCDWIVFERLPGFGEDHGPSRFSLIHLHADGAAAFSALYVSNGLAPSALAIIQPGTGFGGNWTDFTDPSTVLGRLVLGNPAGVPEWLLYGGMRGPDDYRETCWPSHAQFNGFLGNTSISVWRRAQG